MKKNALHLLIIRILINGKHKGQTKVQKARKSRI